MTKEELKELIEQSYWRGFKDAGKLIYDMVADKKVYGEEIQPNNSVESK